ncbi:unnamed protein product (mitochondrion) [Plasmodiophora brassicae]|uniref:Uncharacterized protein n=1 Tax=Plasmodiophora brassicae TaxID=37360 RepID=A0A3P3YBE4_PLABS|nr:unnamed protein product [Plasmodiophora brassicae]
MSKPLFTADQLLTEFIRGMAAGWTCIVIAVSLAELQIQSFLWDYYLVPNCRLKIITVFPVQALQFAAVWAFQLQIVYHLNARYMRRSYLVAVIAVSFFIRASIEAVYGAFLYTTTSSNGVCLTQSPLATSYLQKVGDLVFDAFIACMIVGRLYLSMRQLGTMKSQQTRQIISKIMGEQESLATFSFFVQASYLILLNVFPTNIISTLNAFVTLVPACFMSMYLLSLKSSRDLAAHPVRPTRTDRPTVPQKARGLSTSTEEHIVNNVV